MVPAPVLDEIALNIALFPYWSVDLTRRWIDIIPASDASQAFGFGLCIATAAPSLVREVASLPYDVKPHDTCSPENGAPPEKLRDWVEIRLPFGLSHFKPVMTQKARWTAHSGGLEASAAAQSLRLLSRRAQLHSL